MASLVVMEWYFLVPVRVFEVLVVMLCIGRGLQG